MAKSIVQLVLTIRNPVAFVKNYVRISEALSRVEKGSKIFISYFADFHDWESEGIVTQINRDYRFFRFSRIGSNTEEKIFFDDLYDIRVIG